jgi:hypothetical protein
MFFTFSVLKYSKEPCCLPQLSRSPFSYSLPYVAMPGSHRVRGNVFNSVSYARESFDLHSLIA